VSHNGHDDIATRLRREASATAPERLRADVMLRVRAEPRPQRIRPRRRFGRSFATVAAAACVLGALVFGASRVDFGGSSSSSGGAGGGSAAAEQSRAPALLGAAGQAKAASPSTFQGALAREDRSRQARTSAAPRPLRAAISGRAHLATPLRQTFGALDPYHLRSRR
jgi:negative regulator of sigma E activity